MDSICEKKRLRKTAADSDDITPLVDSTKSKPSKATESLTNELAAQRDQNAILLQELQQAREALRIQQASSPPASAFGDDMGPSSTGFSMLENSRLLSSIYQLSANSINVPECKPMAGDEEIHRVTFETWKDLLIDNMNLAGIEDEKTKFTLFRVKAGTQLLEVFKNTISDSEAPDDTRFPFQNAMHRLSAYFASGSDMMLQRRRLALMAQQATESDLAFVMRVSTMARHCGFDGSKQFEEVVSVISQNALDEKVRAIALKMTSQTQQTDKEGKANFKKLTDKVREVEAVRLNEELVRKKKGTQEPAVIASVRADHPSQKALPYGNAQRFGVGDNRYHPYGNAQRPGAGDNRYRPYVNAQRPGAGDNRYHPYGNAQRPGAGDNGYHPYQNNQRFGPGGNRQRIFSNKRTPTNQFDGAKQGGTSSFPSKSISRRDPSIGICWRCKGKGHTPEQCYAADKDCRVCGKIGHLGRVCPPIIPKLAPGKIAMVEKDDVEAETDETVIKHPADYEQWFPIAALQQANDGFIKARVAGMECEFLIDSGAMVNTFTKKLFDRLKGDPALSKSLLNVRDRADIPLKAYASQGNIHVLATFEADLYITEDRPYLVEKFYVVDENQGFAELAGEATITEAGSSALADGKDPHQVAGRELRRRDTIRKPTKYDDRFVYNVYQ
ncbi:hypothetical protein quinque_005705 [Culex quinquefasciatus]